MTDKYKTTFYLYNADYNNISGNCNSCNNKKNNCSCPPTNKNLYACNLCVNLDECIEKIDSKCIYYNFGKLYSYSGLSCLGISSNTKLHTILEIIVSKICSIVDEKVKVSLTDIVLGFLINKIEAGDCLNIIKLNLGANEKLKIELDFECLCASLNCALNHTLTPTLALSNTLTTTPTITPTLRLSNTLIGCLSISWNNTSNINCSNNTVNLVVNGWNSSYGQLNMNVLGDSEYYSSSTGIFNIPIKSSWTVTNGTYQFSLWFNACNATQLGIGEGNLGICNLNVTITLTPSNTPPISIQLTSTLNLTLNITLTLALSCTPPTNLFIDGASTAISGETKQYVIAFSGDTAGVNYDWSLTTGTTIISGGDGFNYINIRFDEVKEHSIECTVTTSCGFNSYTTTCNVSCNTAYVDTNLLEVQCNGAIQEKKQINGCDQYQWVPTGNNSSCQTCTLDYDLSFVLNGTGFDVTISNLTVLTNTTELSVDDGNFVQTLNIYGGLSFGVHKFCIRQIDTLTCSTCKNIDLLAYYQIVGCEDSNDIKWTKSLLFNNQLVQHLGKEYTHNGTVDLVNHQTFVNVTTSFLTGCLVVLTLTLVVTYYQLVSCSDSSTSWTTTSCNNNERMIDTSSNLYTHNGITTTLTPSLVVTTITTSLTGCLVPYCYSIVDQLDGALCATGYVKIGVNLNQNADQDYSFTVSINCSNNVTGDLYSIAETITVSSGNSSNSVCILMDNTNDSYNGYTVDIAPLNAC